MRVYLFIAGLAVYSPVIAQVGFKIDNTRSSITDTTETTIVVRGKTKPVLKTIDIIEYNFSVRRMKPKQAALDRIKNELYANSTGADGQPILNDTIISSKEDSIRTLTREIEVMKQEQDSLYLAYAKDYLNYDRFVFCPGPTSSRAFFDLMYDNDGERFKAIGNSGVHFGDNTASIYSEIVGGNLGLLRVGLGTMITSNNNPNDSIGQTEEAYQRLVTNGGNTILSIEYPLLYMHTRNNQFNFICRPMLKATADFPVFGTSTDEWAGSGMVGVDFYADASLDNNSLRFFANFNCFQIYGTSVFQSNLGIDNDAFYFGQLTLGLVFLQNYKLSFIVTTLSSEATLQNRKVIAGGQVLR